MDAPTLALIFIGIATMGVMFFGVYKLSEE